MRYLCLFCVLICDYDLVVMLFSCVSDLICVCGYLFIVFVLLLLVYCSLRCLLCCATSLFVIYVLLGITWWSSCEFTWFFGVCLMYLICGCVYCVLMVGLV